MRHLMTRLIVLGVVSLPWCVHAEVTHDLDLTAGAQTIDTTTTLYADWGYASDTLPNWTNQKSGVTPELQVIFNGLSFNTRDYGHRFTFDDGTSPVSGTDVVADGNVFSLGGGDSLHFVFEDIVDATEKTLTLYTGTFNSGANATYNFDATLTGGVLDEVTAATESFGFPSGTTAGTYSITFSSDTETDLEIDITLSNLGGGTRNFGIAGYTLTAAQATSVPEPSTIAMWSIMGIALLGYGWRRRRRNNDA